MSTWLCSFHGAFIELHVCNDFYTLEFIKAVKLYIYLTHNVTTKQRYYYWSSKKSYYGKKKNKVRVHIAYKKKAYVTL